MALLYQNHWWTMYKEIEMKPRQFITNIKLRKMNNNSESKDIGHGIELTETIETNVDTICKNLGPICEMIMID